MDTFFRKSRSIFNCRGHCLQDRERSIEESYGNEEFRMLDICFAGLDRISCWRSLGPIHLRHATEDERAALMALIGPIRHASVYLLKPDSIEDYVMCCS